MEDDTVRVSRLVLRRALWVGVLFWLGVSAPSAGAAPFSISPLQPLPPSPSSSSLPAAPVAAQPSRLPPLPLFAQAAETAAPVPFAAPIPGSVLDDEDADTKANRDGDKKAAKIECDSDAQCPAQTVCARHVCKSLQPLTSAILYFHRPGPIGFRMVVPFYFSFWHPQRSTRVVAPLFADQQDKKEGTRDLWVFPFYQYHRGPSERTHRLWPLFFYSNYGKEGGAVGLLPLFWSSRHGGKSTSVIPPLLFFEQRDLEAKTRDTVFLPALLYLRERPSYTLGLFLGLGYYYRSGSQVNGGYFPVIWHSSNGVEHKTAVLPLFYDSGNSETGTRFTTLFPLFLRHQNAKQDTLVLTPLGGAYHDHEAQEDTLAILTPPIIRHETPAYKLTVLLPLAALWKNKQNGHSLGIIGPAFYSRDDEGGSEGLIPLYFRFDSYAHRSSTVVVPPLLAALHRSPELKLGFLGPLYGWSRKRDGAYGGGLLPLLSFASGPQAHVAVLPPLLIWSADREKGRYHFSLGPVFYRTNTRGPDAGYDTGIFPLLFISRHGKDATQALLPLFYHHKQPFQELLVLGPLFYKRTCPQFFGDKRAEVVGGIAPLLFWKRSAESSYTALFPLFFEARSRNASTWVAGPMFFHREKLAPSAAPGLTAAAEAPTATTFGLLPLFYLHQAPTETLAIGPLFGYRRTAERRTLVVGPFVETASNIGKPEQSVSRMLFPLYFFHCSPGRRATVIFPLFMQVQDEQTTFRSVALLYYGVKSGDTTAHALLPLFFALRAPGRSTTVVGPLFHHRNEKTGSFAVGALPLFGYEQDVEKTVLATPLGFYLRDHVQSRTRAAFLTFYADVQRNRSDFGLFPIFFSARRGTANATFVLPFFFHNSDESENRSFTLLGPLYFGHRGKSTYGGVAPLFYGRNDGDDGWNFMALPLVYAARRPHGESWLLTPLAGFSSSASGFRFYLGPLYVRRDASFHSVALLPLFYDGQDQTRHARTTFVLPLFLRSTTPERSLTMVTPLFWQQRTLAQRISVLFPLFLDVNNLFRDRTTAFGPLVPLFVRMRDEANDTTSWLFPPILTYVKRTPTSTVAVTFPIIWHFKSADRQTTVLFPLVFYASRPATKTVVVVPAFFYRRDEHENRSLFVAPLLTWAYNGSDGSRERVIFPFVWHFKSAERQTTIVFPLIWHAKRQNYTVTVFLPFGAHWRTEKGSSTLVLNTYVYKGSGEYKGAWLFHFWPLFSVGRPRPQDLEWTVLAGLFGYSREGINRTMRLLWGIHIPLEPVGAKTSWSGATWRMASDN